MFSDHWKIDSDYQTRPAEPPTTAVPGDDLDAEKTESAQSAWLELTSQKRTACDLESVGEASDDLHISKSGGTPLFSKAALTTWPICTVCGDEMHLRFQLFQSDVPCLLCPKDKDGLQIFFCPNECGDEEASFDYRWLDSQGIDDPIAESLSVPLPGKKLLGALRDDYAAVQEIGDGDHAWLESGLTDLVLGDDKRDFFDAWDDYHLRGSKAGGYVTWVQYGWKCCEQSLYLIAQVGWAEGYQYLMGCGECGEIHSEYQGS